MDVADARCPFVRGESFLWQLVTFVRETSGRNEMVNREAFKKNKLIITNFRLMRLRDLFISFSFE